jgi:hypothetical protein
MNHSPTDNPASRQINPAPMKIRSYCGAGFDLLEHVIGDVAKGGRVVWLARRR